MLWVLLRGSRMIKIDNLTLSGRKLEPKTRTIKIYDLISFKLNNENKIQYKPINKNLTINDELQYLSKYAILFN